jgi:exodeoxyribonuclease VII small subunit
MTEPAGDKLKFEDALTELERIVRELEDGQTDLERALARYEQGVGLLRRCYQQLQQAEQRIMTLTGQSEDGAAILKPFAHAATAAAKKPKKDTLPLWPGEGEE